MPKYYVTHPLLTPLRLLAEDDSYTDNVNRFVERWKKNNPDKEVQHHAGITSLMKSPRQLWLPKRHGKKVEINASSILPRIRGSVLHEAIESAATDVEGAVVEERFGFYDENTKWLAHHQVDFYHDGQYCDWKNTTTLALGFEKWEWEAEVNFAVYLLRNAGHEVREAFIAACIDDWRPHRHPPEYPEGAILLPVKLWPASEVESFVEDLCAGHAKEMNLPDDKLRHCTKDERWMRFRGYKGYALTAKGEPSKNAMRSEYFANENEAKAYAAEKGKTFSHADRVETQPIRCLHYCEEASTFCNQHQEWIDEQGSKPSAEPVS